MAIAPEMQDLSIRPFHQLTLDDIEDVGGKNASLGEMVGAMGEAVDIPHGFAIGASGYWHFLEANGLRGPIQSALNRPRSTTDQLVEVGSEVRGLISGGEWPEDLAEGIRQAYRQLSAEVGVMEVPVAVRSSATAEDLPNASFAGQQESYLNVRGEAELLEAYRLCLASLFTDRAITYRDEMGFDHMRVGLSVGVQEMVRSDLGGAGVMFTIDPDSGFPRVTTINAAWGLGENVVKGRVNPDRYAVFRPLLGSGASPIIEKVLGSKSEKLVYVPDGSSGTVQADTSDEERSTFVLTDEEVLSLAGWGETIEAHYGRPMDIEWAKDGVTGRLFVVQARPETVESRSDAQSLDTYTMTESGTVIAKGLSVGRRIASGVARRVASPGEAGDFSDGDVLVAEETDPDWGPLMSRAAAVVTNTGGRTSHAAIVSRELGIPAIVGTGSGTTAIEGGCAITVDCAGGDEGRVYAGALAFERQSVDLTKLPTTEIRVMVNLANPDAAFNWWRLPTRGVGLARIEFVIAEHIGLHPMAAASPSAVEDEAVRAAIYELAKAYESPAAFFVDRLARDIAKLAAFAHPEPVIVRTSDFKANEYGKLLGGEGFEVPENNPMLGFRGASRYYSPRYQPGFLLECEALRVARDELGFKNIIPMIPFCRTLREADKVLETMKEAGLERGREGLEVYVMCEVPSNVVLAEEFADRFDGFSIGSNDLTQLALGVDRDSGQLAHLFDERNEAVLRMIRQVIVAAHKKGRVVGICGQGPSDHPDFAEFLIDAGIDSISLNPDSVVEALPRIADAEKRGRKSAA